MKIYLNGKFVEKEETVITPFNRAFLFGEGIFETLRVYNGKPFRLDCHIARMNNSLPVFGFGYVDKEIVTEAVYELLKINKLTSARLRITVTGEKIESSNQIILIEAEEFKSTFPEFVRLMTAEEKLICGDKIRTHKITSYLKNNFVFKKVKSLGYDEALFIDSENHMIEGTRTNIFLVKDNVVCTPKLECGILPGITRKLVLEICAELKIKCVEKFLDASELENCDELFLTNSLNEIVPVKKIGERELTSFQFAKMILEVYLRKVTFIKDKT